MADFRPLLYVPLENSAELCRIIRQVERDVLEFHAESAADCQLDRLYPNENDAGTSLELHISLSRPFNLDRVHTDAFFDRVKAEVCHGSQPLQVGFSRFRRYMNEAGTKSFLGFEIGRGALELSQLVESVDFVLARFGKATFFSEPSFHVSVLRSDHVETFSERLLQRLTNKFIGKLSSLQIRATVVRLRLGQRTLNLPL